MKQYEDIKELNIEGAEMSETKHNNTLSSRDRAKKESLNNISGLEEKLTINAYDEMDEKYILGNDSKSTKIDDISFSSASMLNKEKETLKTKTYQQQEKLDSNEGFTNINLKDKNGRAISAREAKALHEQEKEKLSNKITKKAEDKFKLKNTSNRDDISNLYTRISAKRKAKKLIDKKTKEKIEL